MKVSINWIKDFVNLDNVDIEKLISKFTMSVAEVEGIEYKGKNISGVVTAKILDVQEVPNSKKLHLLKVDAGSEVLQIVCGAPNVRVGLVTALAKIGAKLGDITIGKAKLAGLESFGMCCGGDEIGISDDHSGIVELNENTPIGVDIKTVLDMEDTIFEIDNKSLTNRPDLWGHYGIAREIAALTNRELKPLDLAKVEDFKGENVKVDVSSKTCLRYTCASMKNVNKKQSSLNMQIRLFYCGMRGINLLADITNYVMLELGQPMHAFDNDIVKNIQVYDLENDFTFKTLDSTDRKLQKGNMVIATNNNPVALAGIMGGENSEITNDTTSVLIESANFDSYKVRTTATSLGMRTEASARYEKSLDPELTLTALLRYVYLILKEDNGAQISSNITDVYNTKYPQLKIKLTKEYIDNFIGIVIPEEKILNILQSLQFKLLKNDKGEYEFLVPSFRATKDINGKADLVEEITRIYGYDNITPKSLVQKIKPALLEPAIKLEYDTKYTLAQRFDLNETHSYIWYDLATNNALKLNPSSVIRCVNSINKDNDKIRSTIIPSLLKVVVDNKNNIDCFGTFEVGRVVKKMTDDNLADETKSLGVVLYNKNGNLTQELLKLKEILNYLFDYIFKMKLTLNLSNPSQNYYHPKNYYKICANDVEVGDLFALHPISQNEIESNSTTVGFEINLADETKSLGVVLYNKNGNLTQELFKLKEILNYLFEYIFKMKLTLNLSNPIQNYYHPKNYYKIFANDVEVGDLFALHPISQNEIESNSTTVGFEINFTILASQQQNEIKFEKISKFPTTKLDFNFLIPKNYLYKDIINIAQDIETNLTYKVSLLDIYENENGTKSYTLHYDVNSFDKNLTTEDIEAFHSSVINRFKLNNIELKL